MLALAGGGVVVLAALVLLALELSGSSEVSVDPEALAKAKAKAATVEDEPDRPEIKPPRQAQIFKKRRIRSAESSEAESENAQDRPPPSSGGRPVPSLRPELVDKSSKQEHAAVINEAMNEANRLYDRRDFMGAREAAIELLKDQPKNVRMNRIAVSASCILGDADIAEKYYDELPERDQRQMARRCKRYQIEFE
jgi:hypothetical protein